MRYCRDTGKARVPTTLVKVFYFWKSEVRSRCDDGSIVSLDLDAIAFISRKLHIAIRLILLGQLLTLLCYSIKLYLCFVNTLLKESGKL